MRQFQFYYSTVLASILLILPARSADKTYLWPTEASHLLTSTFAEYRQGRFHAGIDVKTWGRVGFPVVAIRSGYVSRVEVSPWGYGRSLYLTLDTGETALYAHLLKFNPGIEAYVQAAQIEKNRFSVDLNPEPDRFPVDQGTVLAFTGQSGTGFPHLHFEILDEQGRPTNPLLKGYPLTDTVPPTIKRLAIIPLTAETRVNGDLKPVVLVPRPAGVNRFTVPQLITVHGMAGFAAEVHDKMEGDWNGFGVYRLQMVIGGAEIFASKCDYFSYRDNRQALLDRDFRLMQQGRGLYNRLFRDYGNELPFYGGEKTWYGVVDFGVGKSQTEMMDYLAGLLGLNWSRPAGVIDWPPGEQPFCIIVEDFFGNRTTIDGRIRAVAEASDGEKVSAAAVKGIAVPPPSIDSDFYDQYVRLEISAPISDGTTLHLRAEGGDGLKEILPLTRVNSREWIAGLPLSESRPGPVALELMVENGKDQNILLRETINYSIVPVGHGKNLRTEDGFCQLEFDERSLFKTLYLRARTIESLPELTGLQMSKVYEFMPDDVPMRRGARVCIQWPHPVADKVALFGRTGGRNWTFIGNSLDSAAGCLSGTSGELGTFCLLRDDQSPVISSLLPSAGSHSSNRKPLLKARFDDELSGIGGEDDWALYLDDVRLIAEYDPESHSLFCQPANPLSRGPHQLRVNARDRCGNESSRSQVFYID